MCCTKLLQSCLTFGDSMDCSCRISPGKSTSVGCHFLFGDLPDPGIEPESLASPVLAGGFFTTSATWEAHSLGIL